MKNILSLLTLVMIAFATNAQSLSDFFTRSDIRVTYLGIDFSHVQLIGNFSEFLEAGQRNSMEIRNVYFPKWNRVILDEREKYDLAAMLRKYEIFYDIDMISEVNSQTSLDELESYNAVRYSEEDIMRFVSAYDLGGKSGLAIVFIAETLNKSYDEAWFHFVVLDMNSKEVLFQRRLRGEPNGFGLRNYWINALYRIINDTRYYYFNEWKYKYEVEKMEADNVLSPSSDRQLHSDVTSVSVTVSIR
jgi:hypothetical protein